jgi:anthranilate synthase/aminodeoxychorismate synthase-like glutamine amidotransferase
MILLVDNYDSFTYNVFQAVSRLGRQVKVVRNDTVTLAQVTAMPCQAVIISPGPGTPRDAGISRELIAHFAGKIPVLGICLGHQVIGDMYGGTVKRAPVPVHGKTSLIKHNGTGILANLPAPFTAGRYHSLIVDRQDLPDCLEVTAETAEGLVMGLRHRQYDVEGVQFHPESILTPEGITIFENFLAKIH